DRETGEPLWPIEYRPIPQSQVPGEQSWPTAPFQPALEPYARHTMTSADLSPYLSAEEREYWTKWIDEAVANGQMGLYTPLSHRSHTLALPGAGGATNFGRTAANPDEGIIYIISNSRPSPYDPMDARYYTPDAPEPVGGRGGGFGANAAAEAALVAQGRQLYEQNCQVCHGENR